MSKPNTRNHEEEPMENLEQREKGKTPRTGHQVYESVWFIPFTSNSKLKQSLTEVENRLDFPQKIKYVEKLGTKVVDLLRVKDPLEGKCGRSNCFPCRNGDGGGKFTQQNVTYMIECLKCKQNGHKAQ